MNNLLNKYEALESALRYIGLDPNAVRRYLRQPLRRAL